MQSIRSMVTVISGLMLTVLLTLVPSQALGQSDAVRETSPVLVDHICKTVPAGSPIQDKVCRSTIVGCTGSCLRGIVLEEHKECYPNPGTSCAYKWGTIKVVITSFADCVRDPSGSGCDCGQRRPTLPFVVELPARKCGG